MSIIPRGLFKERRDNTISGEEYFAHNIREKILLLFNDFDLNHLDTSSFVAVTGTYNNFCLNRMKSRLKYILDLKSINNFENYFFNCKPNELFSCVELYIECMLEIIKNYEQYHRSYVLSGNKYVTDGFIVRFIETFNDLLAYHGIPYQTSYSNVLNRYYIENKFNKIEEDSKKQFFEVIDDDKSNEYFTNALISFARNEYNESIEFSYLSLERLLKKLTGNTEKSALENFSELQKKEFRGIFDLPEFRGKIKDQIACAYGLRSKLKSHSPNEKFDDTDFLAETARFQINLVMNLCTLLSRIIIQKE